MSQTGGLSTSWPRTVLSNRGSVAFATVGSATVPPAMQRILGTVPTWRREEDVVDLGENLTVGKEGMELLRQYMFWVGSFEAVSSR